MSAQVKKVLAPLKPVCSVVKSNSGLLTTVLFLVIAFSMLPLNLVLKSNVQKQVMTRVNSVLTSSLGQVFLFLLFVCLYMNADVENMVLLLYVLWLTNNQ
jgi:succinate dehydrogenase/fumarate reductase cytochrome b subunit